MYQGTSLSLPTYEDAEVILRPEGTPEENSFDITLADGLDRSADSGEVIRLDKDERGGLRWKVGLINTMRSEFLGRRVMVDAGEYIMAVDPLTPKEHAALAKRIVNTYIRAPYMQGFAQPQS